MKIVFTGAQGTGKTTILNMFKNEGANVITEVVRNLSKKGVKINKDGDEKGQTKIFNEYKRLFVENEDYVSDRCLIDVVAYTVYLYRRGKVSEDFVNKQLKNLHKFVISNPNVFYCYFPIEFDPVDDGVRDIDIDFQKEIDSIITSLLSALGIGFVIVSGAVDERMEKIHEMIDWAKKSSTIFTRFFPITQETQNT